MNQEPVAGPEDRAIGQLLRAAGPRPAPPAEAMAEVRAAVEAEWQQVVAARRRVRRLTSLAAAAGLAAVAVAWWVAGPTPPPSGRALAVSVVNRSGSVDWRAAAASGWRNLDATHALSLEDELRTAAAARIALDIEGGPSLRLDEHSAIAFTAPGRIALRRGAVYVDSRDAGDSLVIGTPYGDVAHLGTRYQVRLEPGELRVAVRGGRVRVDAPVGEEVVAAGELLTLPERGSASRRPVAADASEWAWAVSIAPAPQVEGMTLVEFLNWAARETGRTLEFASPGVERAAGEVVLHGSVEGLTPDAALAAIMSTTRLHFEIAGGLIIVTDGHGAP